jgi:hypothetical protein
MPTTSSQDLPTIYEPIIPMKHLGNHVEDDNEATKTSKRQRTVNYFGNDFIFYLVDDTLTSLSEAYASSNADYWKEDVDIVMDSIFASENWGINHHPHGCKRVGCKWVFKKKN